ncbi:MAG TPA: M48 family metalloprotease [Vicinamibacterales bacterium]
MLSRRTRTASTRATAAVVALFTSVSLVSGQTKIVAPENKYPVAEDVKAGREAAREVEQQLPMLRDDGVDDYVERIGQRLASAIPNEFQHPEFRYSFDVVNVSDLNAFALPGGPMYINRGMLEAAKNEGEVAGVLAHEISHVALRHGTAQAGKATPYQVGSILGQIAGAIIGGAAGQVVSLGSQFGFGTAFLKYGRDYERQADTLGAQIMASAGYDPRDMANMFQTIQAKGGGGGPEWLSSHPNPGNRYEAISKEATQLRVTNPVRNTAAFTQVKSRLQGMAKAPTTEQAMKQGGGNQRTSRDTGYPAGQIGQVEPPSGRYQTFDGGNLFRVTGPSNWKELQGNNSVTFAPEGGYGEYRGQSVFTHGLQVGMEGGANTGNLRAATNQLIQGLAQSNPSLRQTGAFSNVDVAGRAGLATVLSNVSDVTRQQEQIALYTTQLSDGSLFFVVGVAPSREFNTYRSIFNRSVQSLQLNDGYKNSRF